MLLLLLVAIARVLTSTALSVSFTDKSIFAVLVVLTVPVNAVKLLSISNLTSEILAWESITL